MKYYCTYFDSNYIVQGLALYQSLLRHGSSFRLFVLCFDQTTYEVLTKFGYKEIQPILLSDFEREDEALLKAKENRSRVEYYFTCTSSLPLYIFKEYTYVDLITYLDADLYFFSVPDPIFDELGNNSVLIVEHRFSARLKYLEAYGIFNVGLLSFRRDQHGLQCLRGWRQQCLDWCYDKVEDGRFADQKYLDDWVTRFAGVKVLVHKGAGLAPWNVGNYVLTYHNNSVWVDGQPLVFYHFHGLTQVASKVYNPKLQRYDLSPNTILKKYIYEPYFHALLQTKKKFVHLFLKNFDAASIEMKSIRCVDAVSEIKHNFWYCNLRKIKNAIRTTFKVLNGQFWVVINGKVF